MMEETDTATVDIQHDSAIEQFRMVTGKLFRVCVCVTFANHIRSSSIFLDQVQRKGQPRTFLKLAIGILNWPSTCTWIPMK